MDLDLQPWMTSTAIQQLFAAIPHSQERLRFVGGCVRDALINQPVQDIDLATSYEPEEIMTFLEENNIKVIPTGLSHGTVMAVLQGQSFEITTLRRDEHTDGRHAVVSFTDSWEEDAARRDFTFNALYLTYQGEIYDPWGGISDLKAGLVRFIGNTAERIQEDYLRILRYFRFYARFSKIPPMDCTLKAIADNAPRLETISGERIQAEMLRLLTHVDPRNALTLMAQTGVLPRITQTKKVPHSLEALIDLEQRYNLPPHPLTRLYNLIDHSQEALQWVLKRYKFSGKEAKWLLKLHHMKTLTEEPLEVLLYFQGKEHTLAWFLSEASKAQQDINVNHLARILNWEHLPYPYTGQDLIKEGLKPGPDLGKELKKRERAWVLSNFNR